MRCHLKAIHFKSILSVLLVLLLAAAGIVLVILLNADLYITFSQRSGMVKGEVNSMQDKSGGTGAWENAGGGIELAGGIAYADTYPNSFLDIYRTDDTEDPKPVYFFIHGGGYAWGDKAEGDPLGASGGSSGGMTDVFRRLAEEGFSVVSINYALVPEYRYPTPVLQINEAAGFLAAHASEYGLDMSRVVLSGGSAGGQLAGQYALIATDPAYAEDFGIDPALNGSAVKGVVFRCALLEPASFDDVNTLMFRIMFRNLKIGYYQNNSAFLEEADIVAHVSESFPPAYITDGNHGTFDRQAVHLHEKLDALGVSNTLNLYPIGEAQLEHGYDAVLSDEHAADNLEKEIRFLKKVTE